jgi:hypothetical protein
MYQLFGDGLDAVIEELDCVGSVRPAHVQA